MKPLSIAEIYHEATKYTPDGLQLRNSILDLESRPRLCKSYDDCESIELLPCKPHLITERDSPHWTLQEISDLLFLSNGVTGTVKYPSGDPFEEAELLRLRAAPSAGGLYPTELYLALGQGHEVKAGIYNYHVHDHKLTKVFDGSPHQTLRSMVACPNLFEENLAALIVTVIYERSAWRYEDRAYRRVLLDSGHVMGNISLLAQGLGRRAITIGGFDDQQFSRTLFLDHHHEGGLAILPLLPKSSTKSSSFTQRTLSSHDHQDFAPNTSAMRQLHRSSSLEKPFPKPLAFDLPSHALHLHSNDSGGSAVDFEHQVIDWQSDLFNTIRSRRSARQFTGEGFSKHQLQQLLHTCEACPTYNLPDLIHTYVIVHDIKGLEPGVYVFDQPKQKLNAIRQGMFRRETAGLCLGQELGSHAAAVVVHTANLQRALTRYNDRAYRYLHLDAGQRGQMLNLGAIKLGLGVSGIGGFFDDEIIAMFGLSSRNIVLYLTCLGIAEE